MDGFNNQFSGQFLRYCFRVKREYLSLRRRIRRYPQCGPDLEELRINNGNTPQIFRWREGTCPLDPDELSALSEGTERDVSQVVVDVAHPPQRDGRERTYNAARSGTPNEKRTAAPAPRPLGARAAEAMLDINRSAAPPKPTRKKTMKRIRQMTFITLMGRRDLCGWVEWIDAREVKI